MSSPYRWSGFMVALTRDAGGVPSLKQGWGLRPATPSTATSCLFKLAALGGMPSADYSYWLRQLSLPDASQPLVACNSADKVVLLCPATLLTPASACLLIIVSIQRSALSFREAGQGYINYFPQQYLREMYTLMNAILDIYAKQPILYIHSE